MYHNWRTDSLFVGSFEMTFGPTNGGNLCNAIMHHVIFPTHRYKDRRLIQPGRHYTVSYEEGLCVLRLREVYTSDEGHYMCKAENKAGSTSTEAKVKVQGQLHGFKVKQYLYKNTCCQVLLL